MKIDAKVKGGLAWAGLVIILAVPAADMLFGKSGETVASAVAAGATGEITPAKSTVTTKPTQVASAPEGEAVDKYIKAGKKLPSYISDADEVQVPADKAPVAVTPPAQADSVPAETAPIPLPRDARPKTTTVASLPKEEKPLVLDEKKVLQNEAAVEPFPLSDENDPKIVTGDQLEEWDSGSLADYLERKGMMSDSQASSDEYDPDGFYLDEGPNRPRRVVKRDLDFFLF